jgi:cobalamin biosynthesis Mg chelatase CobN
MRTKGDEVAQILFLLGMRPFWKPENKHLTGDEPTPLEKLGRPSLDVWAHQRILSRRVSKFGFFDESNYQYGGRVGRAS